MIKWSIQTNFYVFRFGIDSHKLFISRLREMKILIGMIILSN